MFKDLQTEIDELIAKIKQFWGYNVSNIQVTGRTDNPYNMFTLKMRLYGRYDVLMEYERSTLGISLNVDNKYIILSKLAGEPVFRGLQSYVPENLIHNFMVLDKLLHAN